MDCGAGFTFPADQATLWFNEARVDFANPPRFAFDPDNPWFRKYQALHEACLDLAAPDHFLMGQIIALPDNDVLALLMGAENFLTALLDHPQWMKAALVQLAQMHADVMEQFLTLNRRRTPYWYGIAGWADFWAPEPFLATQSDVSCTLSTAMFHEFILPELDLLGARFGALWYHLDGYEARHHLPTLLTRDYVRAGQFVPGANRPPNGSHWIELYRQVQAAGRILWLDAPAENIAPLLRQLDPSLLVLRTYAPSQRAAEELLAAAGY
jgi:hypothetical protein